MYVAVLTDFYRIRNFIKRIHHSKKQLIVFPLIKSLKYNLVVVTHCQFSSTWVLCADLDNWVECVTIFQN